MRTDASPNRLLPAAAGLMALLLAGACTESPAAAPADGSRAATLVPGAAVLHVPGDYPTIQAAVAAAEPGATIQVGRGAYAEQVVISKPGIRLHASAGVLLDGSGLGGIGIHVLGTAADLVHGVVVAGFEVSGYERGIVVQWAHAARIHRNDVHQSLDRTPPLALGDAIGIDVVSSVQTEVSQNRVHDNGDTGVGLRVGSNGSLVRGNWIYANGTQHLVAPDGRGVLITGAGTFDNQVLGNEVIGNNGRGVLIARPGGTALLTGNRVAQNRLHQNQRSGVALMGPVSETVVEQNDARGNNLSGLAPCIRCNLVDMSPGNNLWRNNLGTFNLADPSCLIPEN